MVIYKAYKFRVYPNKIQENMINKNIGSSRFVFNHYLDKKIKECKESNKIYLKRNKTWLSFFKKWIYLA